MNITLSFERVTTSSSADIEETSSRCSWRNQCMNCSATRLPSSRAVSASCWIWPVTRFSWSSASSTGATTSGNDAFGASTAPELATGSLAAKAHYLFEAIGGLIARRTFVLESSPRPTIFLEWFVIAATIYAIRRREWATVLRVAVLMATVYGVDLLGMARGLKQEYFLITDPLVIIAGAILLARLPALQVHRFAWPIGAALIVVHIAISQAEPVKHVFRHDSEEVLCGMYHNAKRVERLPVCATLPKP